MPPLTNAKLIRRATRVEPSDQLVPDQSGSEGDASEAFGKKLKALRLDRSLSLADVASVSGLNAATLSRIENNKMAPTYLVLLKLIEFFNLDFNDLVPTVNSDNSEKFFSSSRDGRDFSHEMKTARRTYPHGQNHAMSFQPVILEISPRRTDEHRLAGHSGIEFCYVLSGTLRFHAKGQKPQSFEEGESVFFDSRIPHAYMSADKKTVRLLVVSSLRSNLYAAHEQR